MKYNITGEPFPVVICNLDAGEKMITESGAMAWMSPNMKMETVGGGAKKALGRLLSGDTLFLNHFTAQGGPGEIAFASSFPGKILPMEIKPGQEFIAQKNAFLCSEASVDLDVFFRKKIGTGLFGGEGFIMQKLSGQGMVFLEIDGSTYEYNLGPNQSIVIDTGYLAGMDATCTMDIQSVPGVKNMLLGGEGLFNTVVTGPGRVLLQTHPISAVASAISPYIATSN
jgi:uncharacterized protein (TIGR00266 family)